MWEGEWSTIADDLRVLPKGCDVIFGVLICAQQTEHSYWEDCVNVLVSGGTTTNATSWLQTSTQTGLIHCVINSGHACLCTYTHTIQHSHSKHTHSHCLLSLLFYFPRLNNQTHPKQMHASRTHAHTHTHTHPYTHTHTHFNTVLTSIIPLASNLCSKYHSHRQNIISNSYEKSYNSVCTLQAYSTARLEPPNVAMYGHLHGQDMLFKNHTHVYMLSTCMNNRRQLTECSVHAQIVRLHSISATY